MDKDELRERLNDLEIIFVNNGSRESHSERVMDGYMSYGDDYVFQISRTRFDMDFMTIDIQIYFTTIGGNIPEIYFIELRGISLIKSENKDLKEVVAVDPSEIDELINCLVFQDPESPCTKSSIIKSIKDNDLISNEIKRQLKGRIFIYPNTTLGTNFIKFDTIDEFIEYYEEETESYIERRSNSIGDEKTVDEKIDILGNRPIYEITLENSEDDDPLMENGLMIMNSKSKYVTQFVREVKDGYNKNIQYFYFDDNEELVSIVEINNITFPNNDFRKEILDNNYINDRSPKNTEAEYIKSLLNGTEENFVINNWDRIKLVTDKDRIKIEKSSLIKHKIEDIVLKM